MCRARRVSDAAAGNARAGVLHGEWARDADEPVNQRPILSTFQRQYCPFFAPAGPRWGRLLAPSCF